MDQGAAHLLTANDLRALPEPARIAPGCACASLVCPGWESIPAALNEPMLKRLGTLRDPQIDDPSYEEWSGTGGYWSGTAPIAALHFPYNRCEVWACTQCGRGFLQYTEFGGYYVDHRVRQIDPGLVV